MQPDAITTVRLSPRTRLRLSPDGRVLSIGDHVRLEFDPDFGAVGVVAVAADLIQYLEAAREQAREVVRVEAVYPLPDGVVDIGSVGEFLGTLASDWAPGEITEAWGK